MARSIFWATGCFGLFLGGLIMQTQPVAAADAAASDGPTLFADKGCVACHGEDALTGLDQGYPRLAGQSATYLLEQMRDIKSGKRANGLSADTMVPILAEVSDAEMEVLATWLATLPNPSQTATAPDKSNEGRKLYMTRSCVACHGKDGRKPIMPTYPMLAGQDPAYVLTQSKDIKNKVRTNGLTNAMQPVMHLTSDEELEKIAAYLAAIR